MELRSRPIVVVEDDRVILTLMCDALEDEGYAVVRVDGPHSAKRALGGVEPAMFLVDIMLPEVNGIQLAKELRATKFPQTPMVAMTASPSTALAAEETDVFQEVMAKPFDLDDLLRTIHRYMQ